MTAEFNVTDEGGRVSLLVEDRKARWLAERILLSLMRINALVRKRNGN